MKQPSKSFSEIIAAGEEEKFATYTNKLKAIQKAKSKKYGKGRLLHRKGLLALKAEFQVDANLPAHAAQGLGIGGRHLHVAQPDRAGDARIGRQQAGQRERRDALARAGFADDAEHLVRAHVEVELRSLDALVQRGALLVLIDLLLAGDNAVVIALAVKSLPKKERRWGIMAGVGLAVVLRILLTFFAAQLLLIQFVKLIGGLLILWIAVKLLMDDAVVLQAVNEVEDLTNGLSRKIWQKITLLDA